MQESQQDPLIRLKALRQELREQLRHAAYFPERMHARAGLLDELREVEDRILALTSRSPRPQRS